MTRRQRHELAGYEDENQEINIPPVALYLWEWFFELSNARHEFDRRISYLEMDAWSRLGGHNLTPQEFEFLTAMDVSFVDAFRAEMTANAKRQKHEQDVLSRGRK